MSQNSRGSFIAIEGGDGAGKSTTCDRLHRALIARGRSCFRIDKNPSFDDPFLSDHIARLGAVVWAGASISERKMIGDDHWLYLAAAWYAVIDQHCVVPALATHDFVLADSWTPKLLSRFSIKSPAIAREAVALFGQRTTPDRIFYLDVDPARAAARKPALGYAECGNFDGYSGCTRDNFIAYQKRVRDAYRTCLSDPRWTAIEADDIGADEVVAAMLAHLV